MNGAVEYVTERLERWGATHIFETGAGAGSDSVQLDFFTPFPGEQPIQSSIVIEDGEVVEATIRYGVLDSFAFPTHPANDTSEIIRLRKAADIPRMPDTGHVLVNYGDTGRKPRPHLLYGWHPDTEYIDIEDIEFLRRGEYHAPVDPEQFMDWMVRVGRRVRREFGGEWVDG